MTAHAAGDGTGGRYLPVEDGEMHVVEDGEPGAPALLLLTNGAAPTAIWDPVVPALAATHHVLRVNPFARGSRRHDVPTQARRVVAVLDRLGVERVTAVGHSSGAMVATAVLEHRPEAVVALVLIDMSPDLDGKLPEARPARLLLTRFPGRLLWALRTGATIRNGARSGFTRPVDVPEALVEYMMALRHRDLLGLLRAYLAYLGERGLPERLGPTPRPLLVMFGADDQRWRSSSVEGYRVVPNARIELLPGVGHMPMIEDPDTTARLLLEFAAAAEHPR